MVPFPSSQKLTSAVGAFSENEWAFDLLYCMAFMVMDKQWLERNATYMEFNVRNLIVFIICSSNW